MSNAMITGRDFPCPKCGAPKGDACNSAGKRGVSPHKERMDLCGITHRDRGNSACQKWLEDHVGYDKDDCLAWPFAHIRGYGSFKVNRKKCYAHRYMCMLIHGDPPSDEHQASHSCGKGHEGCVSPRHLFWKTPSGNQLDRRSHGTTKRNTYGPTGRLTIAQAEEIRRLRAYKTQDELASIFGTSRGNVQFILSGKTQTR